jgi:hypothetical protein
MEISLRLPTPERSLYTDWSNHRAEISLVQPCESGQERTNQHNPRRPAAARHAQLELAVAAPKLQGEL